MDKLNSFAKSHRAFVVTLWVLCALATRGWLLRAQSLDTTSAPQSGGTLIAEFRRVEVASVSDALEQLTGKRMYMSHRMQPIFTVKFAGLTVKTPPVRAGSVAMLVL